jgi:hypothetical protein
VEELCISSQKSNTYDKENLSAEKKKKKDNPRLFSALPIFNGERRTLAPPPEGPQKAHGLAHVS